MERKPRKLGTSELFDLISELLTCGKYRYSNHGQMRSMTRSNVTDYEIIRILSGRRRWHEKAKDRFDSYKATWRYHIRGINSNDERVRIVITIDETGMIIITVINLDEVQDGCRES